MIYDWRTRESHQRLADQEARLLEQFVDQFCSRPRVVEYHEELAVEVDHDDHALVPHGRALGGKVALVTGGSRGIGRAIAIRLAREGANMVLNYRSDEVAARETADAVASAGGQAILAAGDVTRVETASKLVAEATARFGTLDILVNNVGEFFFKPLDQTTRLEWDGVLASNLSSVQFLCQAALPVLRKTQGTIINIALSPVSQVRAAANVGAYAISKTGVLVLTRTLAAEQAAHGVRINSVSPGLIDNGFLPPAQKLWMQKRVPMGRLGTPEEVADAVVFLTSPSASYISGANLAVAGGWDWEDRPPHDDGEVRSLFMEAAHE